MPYSSAQFSPPAREDQARLTSPEICNDPPYTPPPPNAFISMHPCLQLLTTSFSLPLVSLTDRWTVWNWVIDRDATDQLLLPAIVARRTPEGSSLRLEPLFPLDTPFLFLLISLLTRQE